LLIQHACLISVARTAVETPEIPIDPRYVIGVTQIGLELRTGCPDFFEQFFVGCDGGGCLACIGVVIGKRTKSGIDLLTTCRATLSAGGSSKARLIGACPSVEHRARAPSGRS
jgi:hypothetical protein